MNKTDVAPIERITAIESQIAQLNPTATVHRTVRGNIDLKHLMGIKAYATGPAPAAPTPHHHEHAEGEECDHDDEEPAHHYELRGISSLQVSCPVLSPPRLDALDEWIRTVLWDGRLPGEDNSAKHIIILRCKGMFRDDSGKTHVLQGVRDMYEITALEDGNEEMGVPDEGKLVFIGKGLDERVRESLVDLLSSKI